ncbi:MAG TPA: YbjN domain-containing protein [Gemmatimonadales bacterium]|nr:YbjN domain-containing protein [Gemmatimonadales bacterium]
MVSRDDLEGFIARLEAEGAHAREIEPGLWVLSGNGDGPEVVVHYAPPVVVLRVKVMTLPRKLKQPDLYRHLLELNAKDLVHGSYGVDGNDIVLSDTLELENLDFNEFQASFESMTLALASHLGTLAPYREA